MVEEYIFDFDGRVFRGVVPHEPDYHPERGKETIARWVDGYRAAAAKVREE
jgi:hypothetical protein